MNPAQESPFWFSLLRAGGLRQQAAAGRRRLHHVSFEPVNWSSLPGWRADDALAAWPALVSSCSAMRARPEWQPFCAARGRPQAPPMPNSCAAFSSSS